MPDLDFKVESVELLSYAVSPHLAFKISVSNSDTEERIENVMLRCQIQIETVRRQYNDSEKEKLFELYGEPARWGQTLKTLLWTHANVAVPPFTDTTSIDLPVPCTFDFNVATTKFFDGLDEGEIPLCFLFSGTVFYRDEENALQVAQISWEKESNFRLPVSVWKTMMDHYYPNSAWLNIRKDVFEQLQEYRVRQGLTNWETVFEKLLPDESEKRSKAISV
ncbi:MAG: DUF6084 family protein [Pyrinomonadaceae bacterium]